MLPRKENALVKPVNPTHEIFTMIDDLKIIKVTSEKEYKQCLNIRRAVFIEEQGVDEVIEVDKYEKDAVHFLALIADQPVACGRYRKDKNYLKFERIATLASYRKKGIGKAIMQFMQKTAVRDYPEYTPYMHAQFDAVPFYEKLGWRPIAEPFFEADIKHIAMIL